MTRLHYPGVSLPAFISGTTHTVERTTITIIPQLQGSLVYCSSNTPSYFFPHAHPPRLGFPSRPRLPYAFKATPSPVLPPPPSCCKAALCGAGVGRMGGTLAAQDGGRVLLLFPEPNVSEIRRLVRRPPHISQFSILLGIPTCLLVPTTTQTSPRDATEACVQRCDIYCSTTCTLRKTDKLVLSQLLAAKRPPTHTTD